MRFYALHRDADASGVATRSAATVSTLRSSTDLSAGLANSGVEICGLDGKILSVRCFNERNADSLNVEVGSWFSFEVLFEAATRLAEPNVGIELYDRFNQLVFGTSFVNLGLHLKSLEAGQRMLTRIAVQLNIMPGEYSISAAVADQFRTADPNAGAIISRIEHMGPLSVSAGSDLLPFYGFAGLPASCAVLDENAELRHQDAISYGA
jgi:hypothetical protein